MIGIACRICGCVFGRDGAENARPHGFGALLHMHLARCEEVLRASSLVVGAEPGIDANAWHELARKLRIGERSGCAELLFFVDGRHMDEGPPRPLLLAPVSIDHWSLSRFDPWQEPTHRAALELARDLGRPQLTAHTVWPGATEDAPVVIWYMAAYRRGADLDNAEQRAQALVGHVGVPIRLQAVVEALEHQLPQARLQLILHAGASEMQAFAGAGRDSVDRMLSIGDRWWTLRTGVAEAARSRFDTLRPSRISLASGAFLTLLLAGLTWLLLTQSARAHALAQRYSRDAREREARLRSVFDGTRDAIFTLDVRGTILGVNQTVQGILGFVEAELVGRQATSLMPPAQRQALADLWVDFVRNARQRDDGHGPVHELTLIHRDGHAVSARGSLSLARIESEEFVVWIVGDLSREREMERRAGAAAALNQAIMDVAPVAVMTFDADGRISSANV
ncbi:MAG: PAS domain S-box protein, partial [Rubrivivax sp.]|nr:PAS domain S-box protein [Rubrivivax sp.]